MTITNLPNEASFEISIVPVAELIIMPLGKAAVSLSVPVYTKDGRNTPQLA